mmetsp:Transcript_17605/g.43012  ORF Transcript_17605/g.43012 Transcript_17605/m.43012 type:complete len:194 (+) Transcript_17605:82-663(+)|eukprot:CAMPEP_0206254752 /NCGR_PEP_ID=MMETSP0047_2-20121206/23866_1 /ASSEMBLY_ACC=CAM_ASM_000192 /TAXON_ID=195065 /ORGANISM="Chroomonas mesostigmatica_cf, Strain CCMP1168" /LENGTH=193 /DNA_ID=CAMNT_0053681075 /DNA_START=59 /DNA_END=640 /DNA_ORIENTATION=+
MKLSALLALACVLGSTSALSAPAVASLRPSVASFRPRAAGGLQHGLALKGGGCDLDLPFDIDPKAVNKAGALVWGFFALVFLKDELHLPLPLMDLTGKTHETKSMLAFGDPTPESISHQKTASWAGLAYGAFGAMLWVVGDKASDAVNKDTCKANVVIHAAATYLSLSQKTRPEMGGSLGAVLLLVANALASC